MLIAIRQGLGLSRSQFAQDYGVSLRTIEAWESGESTPRLTLSQVKTLGEHLKILGLTTADLPGSHDDELAFYCRVVGGKNLKLDEDL